MSQVTIVRATYAEVLPKLRELLAPLGGIEAFVKPGQKVLLKANLLGSYNIEKAVTTDPRSMFPDVPLDAPFIEIPVMTEPFSISRRSVRNIK